MINNIKTIVYHRTLPASATLVFQFEFRDEKQKEFFPTHINFFFKLL